MIKQLIEKIKGMFAQPAPVEFIEPTFQAPVAEPQAAPAPASVEKKPKAPRKRKQAAKKPVTK